MALVLVCLMTQPALAQVSGNPFARPAPAAPVVAAPTAAPPVPSMPPKLLEPDINDVRKSFSELNLVAVSGTRGVLRDGDTTYYVRNGEFFTYDDTTVKVEIKNNTMHLRADKTNKEVYSAEVGNGVAPSKHAPAKSSSATAEATPSVKK